MINLVHAGKVFEFLTRQYIFKVCFIYVEKMTNTVAEGTEKNESNALKKKSRMETGEQCCSAVLWVGVTLRRGRSELKIAGNCHIQPMITEKLEGAR